MKTEISGANQSLMDELMRYTNPRVPKGYKYYHFPDSAINAPGFLMDREHCSVWLSNRGLPALERQTGYLITDLIDNLVWQAKGQPIKVVEIGGGGLTMAGNEIAALNSPD